jgi:type I restriction enzyme, S subunit
MSYPVYAEMRDSGVEWLEKLPLQWDIQRLKFQVYSIEQGWSPVCENRLANEDEWGVLKVGCVNGGKFNEKEHKALPVDTKPMMNWEIKMGDILMSRANTRELLGSVAIVGEVRPKLLLCDKLYRIKLSSEDIYNRFFLYTLKSSYVRNQLEGEATGASDSMQNIGQAVVKDLKLVLPPIQQQQYIAAFLDAKTAEIDELIALKEQQVALLQRKRMVLISRAVTKGLDPHGPMRDSGVAWLGEVPVGWQLTRVKFVVHSIQTGPFGSQLHAIDYVDNGIPVINPSNLQVGKIIPDQRVSIDQDTFNRLSRHVLLKAILSARVVED